MVCIKCGSKTKVFNSRFQKKANQVWRRRRCLKCQAQFTTHEVPDYSSLWAIEDKNGRLEPFESHKLLLSLHRSMEHRPRALNEASSLTETVIHKLVGQDSQGLIPSRIIVNTVLVTLNRFDKAAFAHYEAFHKN